MIQLPVSVRNALGPIKRGVVGCYPRNMRVSPPVAQVFLGGEYESRFTLINFPSLFSPSTAYPCIYDIAFYGSDGTCIGKKTIPVKPFGSFEVCPSEHFGNKLPDLGIFTAKFRSASPFVFSDGHLGKITSHIYALYSDKAQQSLALVHPQTTVSQVCAANVEWKSAFLMDSCNVKKVVAFQINPTNQFAETSLFLFREGAENNRISEKEGVIQPMGARKVVWDMAETGISDGLFSVGARGLPTPNAKPILLTYFDDGTFSGMHS